MRLPAEAAESHDSLRKCGAQVVRKVLFRPQDRRPEEDFSSLKPKE